MRYTPLDLLGGSNVDDNVAWSREDTINYIPQKASSSGARTEHEFRDAPGLKPFVMGPTGAGPVRGSHDCEGKHFVVMGSTFYQITTAGVAIPIGTIPGTQRVNIAHNQIVGGNEVIIATGTPNGYVYNTVTQVFGRITDPGYPGGGSVDYIDTYLVSVEPYGRYWFWSDQANATSYNTLNRTEAESDPDSIVGLAVNSFEVVVFGQQTVEFFYNAGGINGSTFRSKKVMNNHGCAARDSIVKLDNSLFWLGVDGILYRLNGYQAMPISSPQFTQRIAGLNWAKAFAFAYEDQGHVIYYITFPDGQTWGYDVTTGLTVRRESYGLNRWRLNTLTKVGRKWIGGDFQSGLLYEVDWNYPMEGEGTPLVRERVTGNVANNQNKIEVPLVELLFQTGTPEVEPVMFVEQPDPPTISGDAPDSAVGIAYPGYAYTVSSGGIVTLRSGSLPIGVEISSAGVLNTDIATTVGDYAFRLRVTDPATGLWAELDDTIIINTIFMALPAFPDVPSNPNYRAIRRSMGGVDWSLPPLVHGGAINYRQIDSFGDTILLIGQGTPGKFGYFNGTSWTHGDLPITMDAASGRIVRHGGFWYVSAGQSDEVLRSADGITFTQPSTDTKARVLDFVIVDGRLLGTSGQSDGTSYYVYYTDDPSAATPTWARIASGVPGATVTSRIATDGVLCVVISLNLNDTELRWSDDKGATWTAATSPFAGGLGNADVAIHYSESLEIWVASDSFELAYSLDGKTAWTLVTNPLSGAPVVDYDSGNAVIMAAVNDGTLLRSTTGMAWTLIAPSDQPTQMYDVEVFGE